MTMVWTPCYFWLAPLPPLPNNAVTLLTTSTLSTSSKPDALLFFSSSSSLSFSVYAFKLSLEVEFELFFYAGNESVVAQLTWEI